MPQLIYLRPDDAVPSERHVAVVIHRDSLGMEKGYFFDSAEGDFGGSGPFDWRRDEAIDRAKQFAQDAQIALVVVQARMG